MLLTVFAVDGASWRISSGVGSADYPDFLLSGDTFDKVKGKKKSKL